MYIYIYMFEYPIRWSKYDDPVPGWELPASWAMTDIEGDNDRYKIAHVCFVCVTSNVITLYNYI